MYMQKNRLTFNTAWLLVLMGAAAAGIVCGAFSGGAAFDEAQTIAFYRTASAPVLIILNTFKGTMLLSGICFLLGFSAVTQPAEAAVPFIFGTGFGYSAVSVMMTADSPAALASMIPGAALSAAAIAAAARESMRMSIAVFRRTFFTAQYEAANMKLYLQKFLIITAMSAAAAVTDGLSAGVFSILSRQG